MPYRERTIPYKILYSSFGVEILRSARVVDDLTVFRANSKTVFNNTMKPGGKRDSILTTSSNMFGRCFCKNEKTLIEFVTSFLQ